MKTAKRIFWSVFIAFILVLSGYFLWQGNIAAGLWILGSGASSLMLLPMSRLLSKRFEHPSEREQSVLSSERDEGGGFAEAVKTNVSFAQVAGMEEVKAELSEISDFLISPEKYSRFGARVPRGVLFYGPPGTGKTMLAKALATESKANFIYASGSEFIEKFVGVGASRIRSLFERAERKAPCIIFIDELDAIGVSRNSDNNSERDQTLNQLLIELDGFLEKNGLVVIGATNRIDMLDSALIRAGRFDRHIYIGNPSRLAREQILTSHLANKPVSAAVSVSDIARSTAGMSGAELSRLVNEAALLAVRYAHDEITPADLDEALLKSSVGLTNRSVSLGEADRRRVAVHEAGHAILNIFLLNNIPELISIAPRGTSLGLVLSGEGEERFLRSSQDLEQSIAVMLGGRAAEELVLGSISTGAANDLQKANELACQMVRDYGMGTNCKNRVSDRSAPAPDSSASFEQEISLILSRSENICAEVLSAHRLDLAALADELCRTELLRKNEINELLAYPASV